MGWCYTGLCGCVKGPALALQEDIEVCLEDDWRASETPLRQLRTAAERSPSVKAAAGMAEKLQKSLEDTWGLDSQVPDQHLTGFWHHSLHPKQFLPMLPYGTATVTDTECVA